MSFSHVPTYPLQSTVSDLGKLSVTKVMGLRGHLGIGETININCKGIVGVWYWLFTHSWYQQFTSTYFVELRIHILCP